MGQYKEKYEILKKYYKKIETTPEFHFGGGIPYNKIENANKAFASGLENDGLIGFYDCSLTGNGKIGYIFTDNKICYRELLDKPKKIWYDDIQTVEIIDSDKDKDCDKTLIIRLLDGTIVKWNSPYLNKTPLRDFFVEVLKLIGTPSNTDGAVINVKNVTEAGATAAGIAVGNHGEINKLYDEEKFHARQGHGFAAERANDLYDRLTGHKTKILGDDNRPNGADRYVDGVYIQSKYCQTGKACIDECFDDSGFRYMKDGAPMQIEVPSDKYEAAVEAMKERIEAGQVPGVSDPAEAENLVRRGHFTYEQAKNIAKAGTVESLTYDAVNGVIIASSAFGVTAMITLATNLWNGEDFDKSLKVATYSGLKVGGTAFITTILASQLSRAGLNSALVGSSEGIIAIMGPKASAVLINAFRGGTNIYGAAAMKSAAKLLRGNAITATVTTVILSSFDIANIFAGRISGKQLFKNITNTATTVAAGTGGWLAGAAVGSAILPGAGTAVGFIGGILGSFAAGTLASKASDSILGGFIEDDADEMVRIIEKVFSALAVDYLLNQKEAEKIIDHLKEILDGKKLQDMFACEDRRKFAREMLIPIIESEVKKRRNVRAITDEEMLGSLKQILEDISDVAEGELSPA